MLTNRSGFNKPKELRHLSKREIEAYLSDPHKKAAELRQAYEIALDPVSWNDEQNDNVRKAEEEGDDEEEEEDMLEEEDEDVQPVKKRKAPAAKPAPKKPKVDQAPKVSTTHARTLDSPLIVSVQPKKPTSSSSAPRKSVGTEEAEGEEVECESSHGV